MDSKKKKADPEKAMLEKYSKHNQMADKHRAHASLIEAKLRVQGKRISGGYDGEPSRIVSEHRGTTAKPSVGGKK
jgi:hypothetical protein